MLTNWIAADWPVPAHIMAGVTTRAGGVSQQPYTSFNLAQHVNDNTKDVESNRNKLIESLNLPASPYWLEQVHCTDVINLDKPSISNIADGSTTTHIGTVCAVLTADCLPLLLYNADIPRISAIHVGWRGFCQGIVAEAVKDFRGCEKNTLAWIGPCISGKNYEVGPDVNEACLSYLPELEQTFEQTDKEHWLCDMNAMIKYHLNTLGIHAVYENKFCTYEQDDLFYSYRRDGVTGRMATLIWMTR